MYISLIIIMVWVLCAVLSYGIVRLVVYLSDIEWTIGHRNSVIIGSLIGGPAMLLCAMYGLMVLIMLYLFDRIVCNKDDRPSKW